MAYNKAESELPSERDQAGRMAHIIYMNFEHKKLPLSQFPCNGNGLIGVVLLNEDCVSSPPSYYKSGVTMRPTRRKMYEPLMGLSTCFRR